MAKTKPNIVILLSDQHRMRTTGCYGNPDIATPSMDRMAAEGLRFNNCISGSPLCVPYRASLQTGVYLHQHRCENEPDAALHTYKGMAEYLSEAGYATGFVGKTHWSSARPPGYVPVNERLGWQYWKGTPPHRHYSTQLFDDEGNVSAQFDGQYEPPLQTDWGIEFIEQQGDEPWCLQLNWGPPHSAYGLKEYHRPDLWEHMRSINKEHGFNIPEEWLHKDGGHIPNIIMPQHLISRIVPQEYLDQYDRDSLTLEPDVEPHWETLARYYYQEYYAGITSVDREVGRVLDYLKASGKDKNTIVIYTSDHGELLCSKNKIRSKNTPYQNALRVPFIAWGPQANLAQKIEGQPLINTVDIMPTILELAGIDVPSELPGVSQASWLIEGKGKKQESAFIGLREWRGVFDGKWLYSIRVPEDKAAPPSWEVYHLIDTEADPLDQHDLANKPEYTEIQNQLHARLLQYLKDEDDHEFLKRMG